MFGIAGETLFNKGGAGRHTRKVKITYIRSSAYTFGQRKPHSNGYPKDDPPRSGAAPPNADQRTSRDQTRCPHGQARFGDLRAALHAGSNPAENESRPPERGRSRLP